MQQPVFEPFEARVPEQAFDRSAPVAAEQVLRRQAQPVCCLQADDFEDSDMPEAFVRQGADPGAFEGFSAR